MRSIDLAPGHRGTPKSLASTPAVYPPHPPLMSGGWYRGLADQEAIGPGRFPVPPTDRKSLRTALFLATLGGPLGLCYRSVAAGLLATALTAGLLLATGNVLVLAVVWPVAMVLATSRAR